MTKAQEFRHKSRWSNTKNDPNGCQFSVADGGRSVGFHQCSRKGHREVDGVLFCNQHAEEVELRLGLAKADKIRYAAAFEYGKPKLAELQISRETPSIITIIEFREIIGDIFFMRGANKKNSQYLGHVGFFDTKEEALGWLHEQSAKNIERASQNLDDAFRVSQELYNMIHGE